MQGYKDIGALLANAREERRMSVTEVAAVLHIRPRYLAALEEGDISAMPGLPYAKGYLTRYASYLSLDLVEVLRRFDMVADNAPSPYFFMPHHFSHEKRVDLVTALKCAAAGFLLLLVWGLWIRPPYGDLPLVDTFPEPVIREAEPAAPAAEIEGRAACLQAQNRLYPPCTWPAPEPEPSVMTIVRP